MDPVEAYFSLVSITSKLRRFGDVFAIFAHPTLTDRSPFSSVFYLFYIVRLLPNLQLLASEMTKFFLYLPLFLCSFLKDSTIFRLKGIIAKRNYFYMDSKIGDYWDKRNLFRLTFILRSTALCRVDNSLFCNSYRLCRLCYVAFTYGVYNEEHKYSTIPIF